MFKRRTRQNEEHLDCPKSPTWNEMVEDLASSPKDDVFFLNNRTSGLFTSNSTEEDVSSSTELFKKAVIFMENIDLLTATLAKLNKGGEELKLVNDKLIISIDAVKNQAKTTLADKS